MSATVFLENRMGAGTAASGVPRCSRCTTRNTEERTIVEPPRMVSAASHRLRSMILKRPVAYRSDNLAEGGIAEACSPGACYIFDTP